jgi:hypothetical protein
LYTVETSAGLRGSSATLAGALRKVAPLNGPGDIHAIFGSIRPSAGGSQIVSGQAGA